MPMLRLQLNGSISTDQQQPLLARLSTIAAETLGKPESYMMVVLQPQAPMLFGGDAGPTAFFEVRSVGQISPEQAAQLTQRVCKLLEGTLDIPARRIYANFEGIPGSMWGHDGTTF